MDTRQLLSLALAPEQLRPSTRTRLTTTDLPRSEAPSAGCPGPRGAGPGREARGRRPPDEGVAERHPLDRGTPLSLSFCRLAGSMLAPASPEAPPASLPVCPVPPRPGLLSPEQPFESIRLPLIHSGSLRLTPRAVR